MSRAVVFKTKGKLDLRSITVFGMNAKPTTTTPIGYFGTGLKYAVAVLSREKIPVTFWIDGKKWVVERDPTSFRGKEFTELYICSTTVGGLIKKRIKLPFTTELGKNWDLWQAFRELESNTRDEKGETFIDDTGQLDDPEHPIGGKGLTYIAVESEEFVQEYFDRDKTFLLEGLTERNSTDRVQCFLRKSNYIYYRGIRIIDLKEPSENTYNLLCPIDLTEDRTAKNSYAVEYEIERFIAECQEAEIVKRALCAPEKTYERKLTYPYVSKGTTFQSIVAQNLESVNPSVKEAWKASQPKPKIALDLDWREALKEALKYNAQDVVLEIIGGHRDKLVEILSQHIEDNPYEPENPQHVVGTDESIVQETHDSSVESNRKELTNDDDDIPF